MALKTYNPTTPGQRQLVMVDRSALYKGKPVKALTEGKQSTGGRNNNGRITVRFRGGGHKKAYRLVDCLPSDRKSTRLNSSHVAISYADSCLKKKNPITSGATYYGTAWSPDGRRIATMDMPTRTIYTVNAADGTDADAVHPGLPQFVAGCQPR